MVEWYSMFFSKSLIPPTPVIMTRILHKSKTLWYLKEFLITLFSVFILYSPSFILYCIPFLIPWPHLRLGLIAVLIKEFYFNISVNCWADEWNQWNFACQSFKAAMMKWYRLKWSIHFHAHLLWSICFYSQHNDVLVHSTLESLINVSIRLFLTLFSKQIRFFGKF